MRNGLVKTMETHHYRINIGLGLPRRMLMSYALKLEVSLLIHLGG